MIRNYSIKIFNFKNIFAFNGTNKALYRHIGNHFPSLMMIAGSYFRNKAPDLIGFTVNGIPVDARFIFDEAALDEIICRIFQNLGGFNQQISVPQLIESVATMSALSLFGKFGQARPC